MYLHLRQNTMLHATVLTSRSPRDSLCAAFLAMSAAFQGSTERDFENFAQWLAAAIKSVLIPRSAVRYLRHVVEILESDPDYWSKSRGCGGLCAYPNCSLVCTRASDTHRHCRCFEHQMENMRNRRYHR